MGDTDPGSTAAQGAPNEKSDSENQSARRGLWAKLTSAFSPQVTDNDTTEPVQPEAGAPVGMRPSMLNLSRLRVDDVMIPKAEIVAVPTDIKKDDLVSVFRESGMTRLPVFKGTLDTPMGLVHLKDFALIHGFNGTGTRFNLSKMVRPLIYAPPSMPIGVLLQKMQSDRMHMALVIDEYGGVDGLVTLEDLVEQVIGEIEDEHDIEEDIFWNQSGPGTYIVQSKAPLDEFEAAVGMRFTEGEDDEEIDTLGGLVFLLSGRVPARGEMIPHPSGAEFEIVDADPRRIKRIRVRLPAAARARADAASTAQPSAAG